MSYLRRRLLDMNGNPRMPKSAHRVSVMDVKQSSFDGIWYATLLCTCGARFVTESAYDAATARSYALDDHIRHEIEEKNKGVFW